MKHGDTRNRSVFHQCSICGSILCLSSFVLHLRLALMSVNWRSARPLRRLLTHRLAVLRRWCGNLSVHASCCQVTSCARVAVVHNVFGLRSWCLVQNPTTYPSCRILSRFDRGKCFFAADSPARCFGFRSTFGIEHCALNIGPPVIPSPPAILAVGLACRFCPLAAMCPALAKFGRWGASPAAAVSLM